VNLSGVMQRLPKIATRGKQNPNLVIGKWRSSRQPQEVQYSTCPPPVNGSRQWLVLDCWSLVVERGLLCAESVAKESWRDVDSPQPTTND
jgi:hypothetical protein